ncbi:MAG: hypothetical protein IPJ71_05885 [Bdellovibrionales bacterium]|nr:hypothetical protein [Bdellovibrionales bacterium]
MKYFILGLFFSSLVAVGDGAQLQIVDIGFREANYYIGVEISSPGEEYTFSLCSSTSARCFPISNCNYHQEDLVDEVESIKDESVKSDFSWIFLRSDHSSANLAPFFAEFRELLRRANPKCEVRDLDDLKNRIDSQAG